MSHTTSNIDFTALKLNNAGNIIWKNRAVQKTISVEVTDGMLNIDFLSGAADLPRVSAIEVLNTSLTLKPVADAYTRGGIYTQ